MARSTTSTSRCSCLSNCVDISEAHELMQEIIEDLLTIKDELQLQAIGTSNKTTRACKITATMVKLEGIDNRLYNIYNSIQPEPEDNDEELVSNFSVSVKLDMAQNKLHSLQDKHCNLRTEWHSQNEHLTKLSEKINSKETELRNQSIFCTAQGLILSKMLWKLSNTEVLLDEIVSQEKLILELIKVFGGCLYGFVRTYGNQMPEPSADEYQYVLCLCGVISNLATVPDGRFLLISQSICRQVYDEMIKILPKILVPKAENLKWIMLSAIYNLMICKEGEDYVKNNKSLLQSLSQCIKPPHPNRIIILALKIIGNLTSNASNQEYMKYISSTLPRKRLEELQQSEDSCVIRKQAKHILSSLIMDSQYSHVCCNVSGKEKLIGVTHFDQSETRCQASCKNSTSKPKVKNQKLLTYYILSDSTDPFSDYYINTSSLESDLESTTSLTTIAFSPDADSTTNFQCSSLSEIANVQQGPVVHSAPTSIHKWRSFVSFATPQYAPEHSFRQFMEQATATASSSCVPVKPSTEDTKAPNLPLSEEIQCVQYQFPYTNLSKVFTVSIGDNPQNSIVSAVSDGHHIEGDTTNTSVVTAYRISSSRAILFTDNYFFKPVSTCTQTCHDTSTITRTCSADVVAIATNPVTSSKFSSTSITPHLTLTSEAVDVNTSCTYSDLDVDYEPSWNVNLKSAWQNRTCIHLPPHHEELLDLPSTSTGLYEFGPSCPYVVPIQEQSSASTEVNTVPENKVETACKILSKKSPVKHAGGKKESKAKKRPLYKVFRSRQKR